MRRYGDRDEVRRKWFQIHKTLNRGQSASYYSNVVMEALTLTDIVTEIILAEKLRREEYEKTNMFQQLQLLKNMDYPLNDNEISELTNIKRVRNIGAHNTESIISEQISYEDAVYSLQKIGQLLCKLNYLSSEDIMPTGHRLSARVGDIIGNMYQLTGVIGRGGSSVVYSASHKRLDTVVAVKEIHHDMLRYVDVSKEKSFLLSLDHKGIPRILDVVPDNQTYYIVMEFIDGGTLDREVEKLGYLSETEALDITIQTADILKYLHEDQQIIFQDLKPQNLMIDHQRKVHLIDFGYSRRVGDGDGGVYSGTPLFSSPEQVEGKETDIRSDIYSLGAVLYYLLEGTPPKFDQERSYRRSTSPEMINLIEKALKKERNHRFQSIDEFVLTAKALLLLKDQRKEPKQEMKTSKEDPSKKISSRMIMGGIMLLILAFVLVLPRLLPAVESKGDDVLPVSENDLGENVKEPSVSEGMESTDEEKIMLVLEDFKKLYLEKDSQGLVGLLHEDAFEITDMTPNEFDDAFYLHFTRNPDGFDYARTTELTPLDEGLYTTIMTFRYANGTIDEPITLKKSGDDWKIITGGMIEEIYSLPDGYNSGAGDLSFVLERVVKTSQGAIIKIKVENKSAADYTLGWVSPPQLSISADSQVYTSNLPVDLSNRTVLKNETRIIGVEVVGLDGVPDSIEILNIQRLANGLPDLNAESRVFMVQIP